jgi:hypothetical protein
VEQFKHINMKVKLTVENFEQLRVACHIADATILESIKYGKRTVVLVNVRKPADIFELGVLSESITLDDVTESIANEIDKSQASIGEKKELELIKAKEKKEPELIKAKEKKA